jgi:hypothetical protein
MASALMAFAMPSWAARLTGGATAAEWEGTIYRAFAVRNSLLAGNLTGNFKKSGQIRPFRAAGAS